METSTGDWTNLLETKELKRILSTSGPCLSIYLGASTANNQSQNATRWKSCLKTLEPRAERFGPEAMQLLQSLGSWDEITKGEPPQGKVLAVFRSAGAAAQTWLPEEAPDTSFIGSRFYVKPLLPLLTHDSVFYLLALSQNDTRLLRCTHSSAEQIPLPPGVSANFAEYMNSAKPDHTREKLGTAGPSFGSSKGIVGGTDTEREDKNEFLAHFFRQIDHGVNALLNQSGEPLIIAAVDKELAIYKSVNSYPRLLEETVQGAPNSLKGGEMHARALEALRKHAEAKAEHALQTYNHAVGGRGSNRMGEVITAAREGRVLTLIVGDSGEAAVEIADDDLPNEAIIQTLLHAGQVIQARADRMPDGAPLAAIFRY